MQFFASDCANNILGHVHGLHRGSAAIFSRINIRDVSGGIYVTKLFVCDLQGLSHFDVAS
jgi:hypothetical protein